MKIGAYQFAVTGNIEQNFSEIKKAILQASQQGVRFLVFPECALTGYPPHDLRDSHCVDSVAVDAALAQIEVLAKRYAMCVVVGAITKESEVYYNSAVAFVPSGKKFYHKRALWGWDMDNFVPGEGPCVLEVDGIKIGVTICFEVRFPEFFRELYKLDTDLNVILFYDTYKWADSERYELIKSHIRTRAVENVTYTLSANAIHPHQTAPTALVDRSGRILAELPINREGLLVFDLEMDQLDFGELGRKELSDLLVK